MGTVVAAVIAVAVVAGIILLVCRRLLRYMPDPIADIFNSMDYSSLRVLAKLAPIERFFSPHLMSTS